jgi:hypothetical protein
MREVKFGSRRIRYELRYSGRRTLAIAVHSSGRIIVTAPLGTSSRDADVRVARRGPWIMRQMRRAGAPQPPEARRYVSGASVRLLGRDLMLRVRKSRVATVRLERPFLRVFSPDTRESSVEVLVCDWLRYRARQRFTASLERLAPSVLRHPDEFPSWRLVAMTRRWGSCSRRGTISLHPRLLEHPAGCVDYVVLHELCHLRHLGHGREFRTLLGRLLPEWERWKHRLDGGSLRN